MSEGQYKSLKDNAYLERKAKGQYEEGTRETQKGTKLVQDVYGDKYDEITP
jgi:hypothetical protein